MGKQRHDYEAMKLDFFNSEALTICEYLRKRCGTDTAKNGQLQTQTVGWTKEKQAYSKEIYRKARGALMKKKAAQWEEILEKVETSEMKGVGDLIAKVEAMGRVMDVKDLILVLKHFRVVQGKPAEIAQNLNVNKDAEVDHEAKAHVAKMLGIPVDEV